MDSDVGVGARSVRHAVACRHRCPGSSVGFFTQKCQVSVNVTSIENRNGRARSKHHSHARQLHSLCLSLTIVFLTFHPSRHHRPPQTLASNSFPFPHFLLLLHSYRLANSHRTTESRYTNGPYSTHSLTFIHSYTMDSFRKIDIDQYDEDAISNDQLVEPYPRSAADALADAKAKSTEVRSLIGR